MTESAPLTPVAPCVLEVDYADTINFAFQQNSIPVIRRLEIRNNTEKDWAEVSIRFEAKPLWAESKELKISRIPAGTAYSLTDVPLKLDLDYLAKLSERVRGELRLSVLAKEAESEKEAVEAEQILEKILPIDVYASDEWTGLKCFPEILAAFVTPNLAVVEQLLSNTTQILGKRTPSSSLDGYQANSKKRVYEILDAIYSALREQGIAYSNPPASFEHTGQRIRFATQLLKSRLGTCLDLSLLFAGLLEQAGLHPLVLMHKGHAYVGCWLIEDSFSDPATDDLQSIRKRKELDDLLVFESTLVCDGKSADFKQAIAAAKVHLSQDEIFEYAIDIYRCRSSRIRPLPLERNDGGIDVQKAHEATKPKISTTPSAPIDFTDELSIEQSDQGPESRIDHWKQQLLDLTLRNRLLNFKETKQTIPLLCPKPELIEDELAADQTYKVLEQTSIIAGNDPRSISLLAQETEEDPIVEHLMRELHAKRLRSSLTDKELSRRLLELYRKVRVETEESGANTLYLALGFLEWQQNKDDDRSYRAPLLLIPVQLHRQSVQSGFSLQRYDEDSLINVTLLELLKRDYQLYVPGVNPPPEDESGVDVERVFRLFQQAVREMPGWEVHREVWLAQFSFSKFLLWKDLQDRSEVLSKNAVVNHLMNHAGSAFMDNVEDLDPGQLDEALGYDEIFCPMSADSSQLAATLAASKGKNFVMNGPPGTGKSQTITNIISHCLAEGKRVLFVAEKRAALEVVHHRLSQIGLGPFCLELHSNKSGKAEVLRQFGEAINYAAQHPSEEWAALAQKLNNVRTELNGYVKELHKRYPNKLSAYQCYAWLIAHESEREKFSHFDHLDIKDIESQQWQTLEAIQGTCDQLILRGSERRLPQAAKDRLSRVKATDWTPEWEEEVVSITETLLDSIKTVQPTIEEVATKLGLSLAGAAETDMEAAIELAVALRGAPSLPEAFIADSNWTSTFRPKAETWISSGRARDKALAELDAFNINALFETDTATLEAKYKAVVEQGGALQGIKLWLLFKPVKKALKPGAPKWSTTEAKRFFESVSTLKAEQAKLDQAKHEATNHFGIHWEDGSANWEYLDELLKYGDGLQACIKTLAGDSVDILIQLRSKVGGLVSAGSEFLQEGGALEKLFTQAWQEWNSLKAAKDRQSDRLRLSPALSEQDFLEQLKRLCERIIENREHLAAWCRWQQAYQSADGAGLSKLLQAHDDGALPLEEIRQAFDYAYRNTFLKRLLTINPTLREFYGDEHQKRIDAFRDFDDKYTNLTGQVVAAKLAARLPEPAPRNALPTQNWA